MGFHVALHNGAGKKSSKRREECEKSSGQPRWRIMGEYFFADSSK
jgi:hypothetical protein